MIAQSREDSTAQSKIRIDYTDRNRIARATPMEAKSLYPQSSSYRVPSAGNTCEMFSFVCILPFDGSWDEQACQKSRGKNPVDHMIDTRS